MKKLMFTAAIAAGFAAFGGIESANVVGYSNIEVTQNKQELGGVMFVNVGGSNLDLTQIKPQGSDMSVDGDFYIRWWDMESTAALKYVDAYWLDPTWDSDPDLACWCDVNDDPFSVGDKTFKCGEGFWVYPYAAGADGVLNVAGELKTTRSDIATIDLPVTPNKQEFFTNPMPVPFTLADITPSDDNSADGDFYIRWWDMESTAALKYVDAYWLDPTWDSDPDLACWCDANDDPFEADKVEFKAGQGFWVYPYGANAASTINFTNPFYKAAE